MSRDQKPGKARVFSNDAGMPDRRKADADATAAASEADVDAPAPVGGMGWITAVLFLLACASGGAGLAAARAWGVA